MVHTTIKGKNHAYILTRGLKNQILGSASVLALTGSEAIGGTSSTICLRRCFLVPELQGGPWKWSLILMLVDPDISSWVHQ